MAKYLEIAEQFVREYKERRRLEQADHGGSVSPEGNSRTSQNAEWEEGGGSDGSEGFGGAPSPESQNIGLPWPTYNDGKQFCCERCGVRFDTSAGFAKHRVYGCDKPPAAQVPAKDMPKCPTCGSYYLYREKDGGLTCESCKGTR